MSTASGSISSQPPGISPSNKFTAKFVLPNTQIVSFSGSFSIAVPAFNSSKMMLTFTRGSQLTGKQEFSGIAGSGRFNITLDNGPTISGPISGGPEDGQVVAGAGNWSIS